MASSWCLAQYWELERDEEEKNGSLPPPVAVLVDPCDDSPPRPRTLWLVHDLHNLKL